MTQLNLLTALCVIALALAKPSSAAPEATSEMGRLQKQIDTLKNELEEIRESQSEMSISMSEDQSEVRSFLSDRLTLGGFFESGIIALFGPDTATQVSASSHTLGLNIAATFNPKFRFVSQILTTLSFPLQNINNDPRAANSGQPSTRKFVGLSTLAAPAQAYVEYSASDVFRVQSGLGYVPFGFALQQRELVLFVRRGGPQLLRSSRLVSPLWTGLHVSGSMPSGENRMGYNAYSVTPIDNPHTTGGGSRLWWSSATDLINAGVSSQIGRRAGHSYRTLGVDFQLQSGPFTLVTEFAEEIVRGKNPRTAYIEPNISIYRDLVILYTFVDYARMPFNTTGSGATAVSDPFSKIEFGAGVNWLPIPATRYRFGFYFWDYVGSTSVINGQNRDFVILDLSVGVAF